MNLPYDPHKEEGVTVAPLVALLIKEPGTVGHCSRCSAHIWINKPTAEFMAKNEVSVLCPDCAAKFAKGE
jgi:Zn finger protein HypA/HybF involved in hydrogenase expression